MTTEREKYAALQSKLAEAGLPHESLKVFGTSGRCYVHVTCVSRETADRWAHLLGKVFSGSKIRSAPTIWEAVKNRGTCLKPTIRRGYLVSSMPA